MFGLKIIKRKDLDKLKSTIDFLEKEKYEQWMEKINPKKEIPNLPESHQCNSCNNSYYVSEKKFYEFMEEGNWDEFSMQYYDKKVYVCENCVKKRKLLSKSKEEKK